MTKVLMVCLGNICRSPMAEGLMRDYLAKNQRSDIEVASAATSTWEHGIIKMWQIYPLEPLKIVRTRSICT